MVIVRISVAFFLLGMLYPASSAVPDKRPNNDYEILWTDSPFTSKRIDNPPNPVADYTLAGLGQLEDGWFVVLLHKKDRTKRADR